VLRTGPRNTSAHLDGDDAPIEGDGLVDLRQAGGRHGLGGRPGIGWDAARIVYFFPIRRFYRLKFPSPTPVGGGPWRGTTQRVRDCAAEISRKTAPKGCFSSRSICRTATSVGNGFTLSCGAQWGGRLSPANGGPSGPLGKTTAC